MDAYKNLGSLSEYVQENKDIILKDIVFGGEYGQTIPLMTKELGVKGSAKIHPATITAVLTPWNNECGFNAESTLEIAEVTVDTEMYKVNLEFCPEKLVGKFAEYKVRVGANPDALPFEAEIVDGLVKDINKQVEQGVWTALNRLSVTATTFDEGATAYDMIMKIYMMMPEEFLEDGIIFVNPTIFREYIKDLVDKNLYHYNPADGALEEIFIPGAGVKVRKANGIGKTIVGTSPKNMIYATDFMDNKEEVKVWYSDDDDVYRVKVKFNYGATYIYPKLVIRGATNR